MSASFAREPAAVSVFRAVTRRVSRAPILGNLTTMASTRNGEVADTHERALNARAPLAVGSSDAR